MHFHLLPCRAAAVDVVARVRQIRACGAQIRHLLPFPGVAQAAGAPYGP
jgi:hypothetical protein